MAFAWLTSLQIIQTRWTSHMPPWGRGGGGCNVMFSVRYVGFDLKYWEQFRGRSARYRPTTPLPRAFSTCHHLKRPSSLNDEEAIILLTEKSPRRDYGSLARFQMRQTTPGGVDERLNSTRTEAEKERKSEREIVRETEKCSRRIDLHMVRATAQEHDIANCVFRHSVTSFAAV